jgi:hypothetical protein
MARDMAQMTLVHQGGCPHKRGRCRCKPSIQVRVWDGNVRKFHTQDPEALRRGQSVARRRPDGD